MARVMMCDEHPDEVGAFLITNLDNGDTMCTCATCIVVWAHAMVEIAQQEEPNGAAPAPEPAPETRQGVEAVPTPPRPKSTRRARETTSEPAPSAPAADSRAGPHDS